MNKKKGLFHLYYSFFEVLFCWLILLTIIYFLISPDDKAPSLSIELKQQQRQRRGERRERERKEIEHGFRVEIAEVEERHEAEKQQILQNLEREKVRKQSVSVFIADPAESRKRNGQAMCNSIYSRSYRT